MSNLLLVTIVFPLFGVALIALSARWGREAVRQSALMTSLITLVLAIVLVAHYPFGTATAGAAPFAASDFAWLGQTCADQYPFQCRPRRAQRVAIRSGGAVDVYAPCW